MALLGVASKVSTRKKNQEPTFLNIELPYDPVIQLQNIHPRKRKAGTRRDICTPMFMAALFTMAKRYPSADE